jgi:mono/diheme cytochrome c family protein
MTNLVSRSSAPDRWWSIFSSLRGLFHRDLIARQTRLALNDLPDHLLRDVGLNRSEIDFVANSLASEKGDPTRDPQGCLNRSAAHLRAARCKADGMMPHAALRIGVALMTAMSALLFSTDGGLAQGAQIKRGKYLVTFGGCNDCHTPGYFFGKPDTARFLGGSEVGFAIPELGVFHGPNLTPDPDTGLGKWSADEIVAAITTGRRPDSRVLAPIMPWHAFAKLTRQDAYAIAAFLKKLPPVRNKVPGPFGPNEKPTSYVMKIVPPEAAASGDAMPK